MEEIPASYTIHSTLDLGIQREAEKAIASFLSKREDPPQVAVLVLNPHTGEIKAMVGGRDYDESFFNRATMAKRQSGSAFKPITYAKALEEGLTPISSFKSEPTSFLTDNGLYEPENFNGQYFYRDITLREALRYSDNVVSVKIQEEITPKKTLELAEDLGFTTHLPETLSLVLGAAEVTPLSMAQSYSSFANGGFRVNLHGIKEVKKEEEILFQQDLNQKRVLKEGTAFIITNILEEVITKGTAKSIQEEAPLFSAGKTGTSQDNRDAWFIGYTPSLLACVWIGHDFPRDLKGTGGSLAAPLWAQIMGEIAREEEGWAIPLSIQSEEICSDTLYLASRDCLETMKEHFLQGGKPSRICPIHKRSFLRFIDELEREQPIEKNDSSPDDAKEEEVEEEADYDNNEEIIVEDENDENDENDESQKIWDELKEEIKEKIHSFLQKD